MSSPKDKEKRITHTEAIQLLCYIEEREREGWHYGNKQQFEKRHKNIKKYIENLIKKLT